MHTNTLSVTGEEVMCVTSGLIACRLAEKSLKHHSDTKYIRKTKCQDYSQEYFQPIIGRKIGLFSLGKTIFLYKKKSV